MADTEDKILLKAEEKADEASKLASLAGASADTKQLTKPSSSSGGTQDGPSAAPQGKECSGQSPPPPQDLSNGANGATTEQSNPLTRTMSLVSDDYLEFLGRPHHVEKRFPVDRKKLEKLITDGGENKESAEDFFHRVQDSTGTLILWPSRLKIGAKSKKDPQVKVVGLPANIQQAREMILVDLDAKSTRVTLKIDVAYSEHSHVIGKEGVNIKKVHKDTNCHIHFPDSNRSSYGRERSNQVSITGQAESLEIARRRIRGLLPAAVTFALPLSAQYDQSAVSTSSPDILQMMQQYNVVIHLKPQPHQYSLMVVVRGTVCFLDGLRLAVSRLVEYFTGDTHPLPTVSLTLDIAAQHHRTLIGSGGGNIKKIMAETYTTIQFPDPQARFASNHVVVTGDMDGVFKAREQLLGCLPAVLMFDVHESDENVLSSSLIGDLMQQLDLYISVKPKKGQLWSVIIKSIEQNIQCMYRARTSLLACSYQPVSAPSQADSSLSPQPTPIGTSPRNTPPPSGKQIPPPLKETSSKVTFSVDTVTTPTVVEKSKHEQLGRRVSFKDEVQAKLEPPTSTGSDRTEGVGQGEEPKDQDTPKAPSPSLPTGHASPPAGGQTSPRSPPGNSSSPKPPGATPPMRPTTSQFLDYYRKREEAQQAMKSKVEPNKTRYPSTKYAGNFFSESMPAGAREGGKTPPSPSSTPQGLSSINRSSYQALMNQATQERAQSLQSEQDLYTGVDSLGTLLKRLGLDHYENCFQQQEVDLDTFLTMSEPDLKEVGVTTLGARRKLQIAISELKKKQQSSKAASLPRSSASLGRTIVRSNTGSIMLSPPGLGPAPGVGINRSNSLTRDMRMPKFGGVSGMSRSGRF